MATKVTKKIEVDAGTENNVVVEKTETTPNRIIIAKKATAFRKFATMLKKHEVGTMPVGTAYEIVMEVNNSSGTFYKLNNGMYITAAGDYSITNQ